MSTLRDAREVARDLALRLAGQLRLGEDGADMLTGAFAAAILRDREAVREACAAATLDNGGYLGGTILAAVDRIRAIDLTGSLGSPRGETKP